MYPLEKKPRSRLRLPQLGKSNHLARRNGPVSEFLIMARNADAQEKLRNEISERRRWQNAA